MNYKLTHEVISLLEDFEHYTVKNQGKGDIKEFKNWMTGAVSAQGQQRQEPDWEGKHEGRSAESIISTMIVHLHRYAKMYSKLAIAGSPFSTQEDFIYLINLKTLGAMTKMELIRRNIQDKPTGIQIIGRLIKNGWVAQSVSGTDKRSKVISITPLGLEELDKHMHKIRQATTIVSGNLDQSEKMELIRLLKKLEDFHQPIFNTPITAAEPLAEISRKYLYQN
ncbi:MarR family transcriptional regulator [Flavobacterium album]|uniref:MarR family transcriptional regulator n=1 Tax=Flavobacterium album TaxID=2175091 RepID=A0A2S1QZ21_9FLAO|nr:MarR family winged helix-turn-helix transcriptional regulator [Flavobacterium album]AWH85666.1 MarR family transcriptional regulator [Flavobacterium album]